VTTARQILAEVRRRKWLIAIASGGLIDPESAERAATKQVIAEARKQPRTPYVTTANPDRSSVTPQNARAFLTSYLAALSERMRSQITPRNSSATDELPRIKPRPLTHRPHTSDPIAAPEPEPTLPNPVLIFASTTNTAAVLIPDSEFEPRWRAQSRATENWRHSIEVNERIAARRRTIWVG
jgi:hypothetical protein